MAKKDKEKKKVSPKREKYAKFHKEKQASMDMSMPELTPEQVAVQREDIRRIEQYMRSHRNPPPKEVRERKMLSKR